MPEMKNCPFCGTEMHGGLNAIYHSAGRSQQMICGGCGARGPEVSRLLPAAAPVDAWNKRASGVPGTQEPKETGNA